MSSAQNGNGQRTPFDTGNPLLDEVPAELTTAVMNGPAGQKVAVTVRTASTTLTLLLPKDTAEKWRDQLSTTIGSMSGLILPP